jgi:polar amino acid transport system substrate-binding protein
MNSLFARSVVAGLCLATLGSSAAPARPLQIIAERGTLALCANPNALPFASKTGPIPGFQVELGEKLAQQLGVSLTREWVISAIQYRRADCDIVVDAIAHKDAKPEGGLRLSRPYHRSGVMLAVRGDSTASSLETLGPGQRVGVPVGSLIAMTLDKRGVAITPFVLEDEIVAALAGREIDAAAVTPAAIGWYNVQHAGSPLKAIPAFEGDPDLNWNIAVGMIRPDDKLRERVDAAVAALVADGTIAGIYARYGITLRSPQ